MAEKQSHRWHRGSRFYQVGREALRLGAAIVILTIFRVPDAVPEALGMFGGIGAVLLGGGTWTNVRERDVERAKAEAGNGEDGGSP